MRGYRRPDGRIGIRNHVMVLSTCGCANVVARRIAAAVPGAVATLVGRDGGEQISLEELAGNCGTLTNELLSQLSPRLPLVRI